MTLPDQQARQDCLDLTRHVLAVAPAGSGKTGLLVLRMLHALTTVKQPEQVIAVTFTRKAAAEIRHRVLELLQGARKNEKGNDAFEQQCLAQAASVLLHADEHGWQLTEQPQRIMALTIDGFNNRIAGELPLLSSLGGRTAIADDPYSLYEQAVLELFNEVESPDAPPELKQATANWLRCAGNRLDQLMTPLTQLLARRDQWGKQVLRGAEFWDAQEQQVLESIHSALQFNFASTLGEQRCNDLINIARQASPHSELLHWATDLKAWPEPGMAEAPLHIELARLLLTQEGKLRKPKGINVNAGFPPDSPAKAPFKTFIEELQDDTKLEEAAAALAALPAAPMPQRMLSLRNDLLILLQRLLAHLRLIMGQRGEADYTEIALSAHRALKPGQDQYGEALLRRDEQIKHLLVDEMQDTSQSQIRLLELLTDTWVPGDGRSLFLVGDPQQSIYAFRKAEVRLFLELIENERLKNDLPLHCVELSANFRSAPEVVDWFNNCFDTIFPKENNHATGEIKYNRSEAQRDTDPTAGVTIHPLHAKAEQAEAQAVAERILHLQKANPNARIAILARARPHLAHILEELRKQEIHFAGQDIDALTALPVVRDLVATAKALWHPQDSLSWAVMLRAPWVGMSWADMVALSTGRRDWSWPRRLAEAETAHNLGEEGRQRVERLNQALSNVQSADHLRPRLPDRVEALWTLLGGPACIDGHDLSDARRTLQLLKKHCPGGELQDLDALNRAINNLYATAATGDVEVMTIHKAKGLEFDHVLLVGCGNKPPSDDKPLLHLRETEYGELLVPKPPDHWPEEEVEVAQGLYEYVHGLEKRSKASEVLRLLYVAITRAKRTLDIYIRADVDVIASKAKQSPKPPVIPTEAEESHTTTPVIASEAKQSPTPNNLKLPKGSFAQLLEPIIAPHFNNITTSDDTEETEAETPRAPRLQLPFQAPEEDHLYQPREIRKLRPSERVLSAFEDKLVDEEQDIFARLVGILYHQAMEKICNDGLENWQKKAADYPLSLAAGFRRMGLPEPRVDEAVKRVLDLTEKTINGKNGQWLLAPKPWAAAEYPLAGYRNGEWISASIDRCFEEDGTLWIIDYKTSGQSVEENELEAWLADRKEHYRPQMEGYAALMAEILPDKEIKSVLYFPEWDQVVEY